MGCICICERCRHAIIFTKYRDGEVVVGNRRIYCGWRDYFIPDDSHLSSWVGGDVWLAEVGGG